MRRFVKELSLLVWVLLCLVLFSMQDARSEPNANICFSFPRLNGEPGVVLGMDLHVADADSILAAEATVTFPANLLAATAVEKTTFSNDMVLVTNTKTPGEIKIALAGTKALSGSGDILRISFKLNGAAGLTAPVNLARIVVDDVSYTDCITNGAIIIGKENGPPVLSGPPVGPAGSETNKVCTFKANGVDPENDPVNYSFDWGDGTKSPWSTLSSGRHQWSSKGSYCVKVRARDSKGALSGWSDCATIKISLPNRPPVLTGAPTGPVSGKRAVLYRFFARAKDPEGDRVLYRFSWGDGKSSNWSAKAYALHKWTAAGSYKVKVQARDSKGALSTWSRAVTIKIR